MIYYTQWCSPYGIRLILREKIELVSITEIVLSIEVDLIHEVEDSAETIDGRDRPIRVGGDRFPYRPPQTNRSILGTSTSTNFANCDLLAFSIPFSLRPYLPPDT